MVAADRLATLAASGAGLESPGKAKPAADDYRDLLRRSEAIAAGYGPCSRCGP